MIEIDALLLAAIQSSFLLGLLHGVNPCGHSWLVLAPFVTGEKRVGRVTVLTCAFLGGTALACLVLGASLGAISQLLPVSFGVWMEAGTSLILIILGILLVYNPHILHHHDDHHGPRQHSHHSFSDHPHDHDGTSIKSRLIRLTNNKRLLPLALFVIGFVNMIVPCPTAAVMYGYAINAGSTFTATLVFGTYALSTAIAVGGMIYLIFKATRMASSMQREWVEPLIMRLAGGVIVMFSMYGMYQAFRPPSIA